MLWSVFISSPLRTLASFTFFLFCLLTWLSGPKLPFSIWAILPCCDQNLLLLLFFYAFLQECNRVLSFPFFPCLVSIFMLEKTFDYYPVIQSYFPTTSALGFPVSTCPSPVTYFFPLFVSVICFSYLVDTSFPSIFLFPQTK